MPNNNFKLKIHRVEFIQFFLISCSVLFLILIILVRQKPFFVTDLEISKFIQSIQEPPFTWFMNFLSDLGTFLPYTGLSILTFGLLRFHHQYKASAYLALSVIGSVAISLFFKLLVARPRPDGNLVHQVNQFYYPDSFPSQHVLEFLGLFGFLLFLSLTRIPNIRLKIFSSTIFFILISTIGISRIFLGAHWFTDVLGSYLIGFVWLGLIISFYRRRN